MKSLILFLLVCLASSAVHRRSSHRERASKILTSHDEFVDDRSSVIAAATRGANHRRASDLRSDQSTSLDQEPRFVETAAQIMTIADPATVDTATTTSCPRWGNIAAPSGEAPVPRRGGFAFTMRSSNGASRLVVGGGERRDGSGEPRVLKKLRYLSYGGDVAGKTWINPSPGRSVGADKVWRTNSANVFLPSGTDGDEGDLFVYGGMTSDASDEPSNNARVLRVSSGPKGNTSLFEWFAVATGKQEGVMELLAEKNEKISPGKLQRSTLTSFGDGRRALMFGGDDGRDVQGGTWLLEREDADAAATAAELPSWKWTEHVPSVGEDVPSSRTGHASVSFNDQKGSDGTTMIMIFGGEGQGGSAVDDGAKTYLYASETSTWKAAVRSDIDLVPKPREGHTMTYMPEDRAVYLFGGWCVFLFFFSFSCLL